MILQETTERSQAASLVDKVQRNISRDEPADSFFELFMNECSRRNVDENELQEAVKLVAKEKPELKVIVDGQKAKALEHVQIFTKLCRLLSQLDHETLTEEDIVWLANNAFDLKGRDLHLPLMMKFVGNQKHLVHRIYDENLFQSKEMAAVLERISRYL